MQFLDEPQRFGKTLPVGDMLKHNLLDYSAYVGTFGEYDVGTPGERNERFSGLLYWDRKAGSQAYILSRFYPPVVERYRENAVTRGKRIWENRQTYGKICLVTESCVRDRPRMCGLQELRRNHLYMKVGHLLPGHSAGLSIWRQSPSL